MFWELEIKWKSDANDPEMQQFQADLLQSARDMKARRVSLVHRVELAAAAQAHIKSGNKGVPSPVAQPTP